MKFRKKILLFLSKNIGWSLPRNWHTTGRRRRQNLVKKYISRCSHAIHLSIHVKYTKFYVKHVLYHQQTIQGRIFVSITQYLPVYKMLLGRHRAINHEHSHILNVSEMNVIHGANRKTKCVDLLCVSLYTLWNRGFCLLAICKFDVKTSITIIFIGFSYHLNANAKCKT